MTNLKNDKWNEGDYNCDKCEKLGSFLDGTMWGIGKDNMETCLCNECIDKLEIVLDENGDNIIIDDQNKNN